MDIPEVVTVSDARTGLSRLLAELSAAGTEAEPVLIGAHRKPQAVLLSVEMYERLVGRYGRQSAAASAAGSLRAEGLVASAGAEGDVAEYVRGEATADEIVARAVGRYSRTPSHHHG
ncbi:type II toxin-antitoxin system Phd/YefM family antitoxin [Streptomyces beijiangensis]|uniref:Antitoxin n=1 Tax=Streptomyces beijiangensis TaxID=163361 RepID=A0A939F5B9_9ACTN|nr:type II toxin-antitoxin system Phd/YefM family antitoxin [Streptomyces beijiangensis]MBO0511943.1 type II toxin-antitoxin system Phd/YefM family antitoxin [Streptomyces beijiangensis]